MDTDRIEGKLKEGAGKVTGDESLEREGRTQGTYGKAKDVVRDGWDTAKDAADDVKDRLDGNDAPRDKRV